MCIRDRFFTSVRVREAKSRKTVLLTLPENLVPGTSRDASAPSHSPPRIRLDAGRRNASPPNAVASSNHRHAPLERIPMISDQTIPPRRGRRTVRLTKKTCPKRTFPCPNAKNLSTKHFWEEDSDLRRSEISFSHLNNIVNCL